MVEGLLQPIHFIFVILMVLPFLHFLTSVSWKNKIIYLIMGPTLIYALLLTASRTGFVCLLAVLAGFWLKSRNKIFTALMGALSVALRLLRRGEEIVLP